MKTKRPSSLPALQTTIHSDSFFTLRKVYGLTPSAQIAIIVVLYITMIFAGFWMYRQTGQLFGYPLAISLFFVPLYEEAIFRGFILQELLKYYSPKKAAAIECFLFAIWHLKNIFFLTPAMLITQILFAGLVFAPITTYITLKKKTIWLGVILHYLNNLLAGINIIMLLGIKL